MNVTYLTQSIFLRTVRLCVTSLCLVVACSQPVWAQSYEEGRKAYIEGDYKRAFKVLKPLAESGDSEAQKMMGIMYDYGHGVRADSKKSLKWYIRSAKQGQPAVQYQVGAKYFRGDGVDQDHEEAAKWWELAANGGQVDAQFNLGLLYFRGLTIDRDDAKAARLFRQAAEQGHAHAQYSLAVMYAFGRGVEKDNATALQWFNKSAAQGVAQAQFNLGVFHENGYSVEKDYAEARKWYELASAQGLPEAKRKLSELESLPAPEEELQIEQTVVSNTEYSLSEITPTGIKREDWVLQQRPDTYTLQIGSVVSEQDIVNFIKSSNIESESAYIEVVIRGETRYNALYGMYENYDAANKAVDSLPASLRRIKPWVRNIGVLQNLLNK